MSKEGLFVPTGSFSAIFTSLSQTWTGITARETFCWTKVKAECFPATLNTSVIFLTEWYAWGQGFLDPVHGQWFPFSIIRMFPKKIGIYYSWTLKKHRFFVNFRNKEGLGYSYNCQKVLSCHLRERHWLNLIEFWRAASWVGLGLHSHFGNSGTSKAGLLAFYLQTAPRVPGRQSNSQWSGHWTRAFQAQGRNPWRKERWWSSRWTYVKQELAGSSGLSRTLQISAGDRQVYAHHRAPMVPSLPPGMISNVPAQWKMWRKSSQVALQGPQNGKWVFIT